MSDICDMGSESERAYMDEILRLHASRRPLMTTAQAFYCEDCGEPIPENRIKAVPGTTRCVQCQELFERGTNETGF